MVAGLLHVGGALADELVEGAPRDVFELDEAFVTGLSGLTSFAFLPDGRIVITEKAGRLLVRDTGGELHTAATFPVDSASEKGLLSVLPHPEFEENHRLFVYYSRSNQEGGSNTDRHRVVSVTLTDDNTVDVTLEQILVRGIHGPANHDGGALAIGPDGKLYIGTGDTGHNSGHLPTEQEPPTNYFGTCLDVGMGKILRVNLDGSIPGDNPLVNSVEVSSCGDNWRDPPTSLGAPRKDVWAWGFRNVWRMWFDPMTGNLWVGDVGEVTHEEIDVIRPGGGGKHFGWPWREAAFGYPASKCKETTPDKGNCVDPVFSCNHSTDLCKSMTAGVIIDSCEWPKEERGYFYFGDGENGWIWRLKVSDDRSGVTGQRLDFAKATTRVVHFEAGPDGALYYGTHIGGSSHIARVAPKDPEDCSGSGGSSGVGGSAGTGDGGNAGDAGTGGSAGSDGGSSGEGGGSSGGANGAGGSQSTGGGSSCGCCVPGANATGLLAGFGALLLLALGWRRRA